MSDVTRRRNEEYPVPRERPAISQRVMTALAAAPSRIPVIVGSCGSGRTTILHRLWEQLEPNAELIDLERVATTPEGCLSSVRDATRCSIPKNWENGPSPSSPRAAFLQLCEFFERAHTPTGDQVTFLLDEALEVRTFVSFPGLRGALHEFLDTLCRSHNRFVLTTRFMARAVRLFRDAPDRFEFIHLPPLNVAEVAAALDDFEVTAVPTERADIARIMHALTDGHPRYLRLLAEGTAALGASDPVSALTAQLAPGAPLSTACRASFELRLHRARGYGALKEILRVLSREEPLTLTEVARRLGRTPGSTKDYLSWLEDVDLLTVQRKRYRFADRLLRLWVQLHGQTTPPDQVMLSGGAKNYAMEHLPFLKAPPQRQAPKTPTSQRRSWNMIEID